MQVSLVHFPVFSSSSNNITAIYISHLLTWDGMGFRPGDFILRTKVSDMDVLNHSEVEQANKWKSQNLHKKKKNPQKNQQQEKKYINLVFGAWVAKMIWRGPLYSLSLCL